tara:strand:- start:1875 stop:2642 length:768 start_codon:yes stop_codon:yes gene_type:complete
MKSKLDLGKVLGEWTQEPAPEAPSKRPVLVTPTFDTPLPPSYPRKEEAITDLKEGVRVAASTATLLNKLGMSEGINTAEEEEGPDVPTGLLDPTGLFQQAFGAESPDIQKAKALTGAGKRGSKKSKTTTSVAPAELFDTYTAVKLATILSEYDKRIIADTAQLRTYITNRLLEESKCGDTKHEIRALELLGKISDVGLFSDKTEITVTHTTDSLQHAIKDKIGRLMGMVGDDIQDVEFEEVEEEDEPKTIADEED